MSAAHWLLYALAWLLSLLPLSLLRALGRGLGRLAYGLDRRHRLVTLDNLRHAFPQQSPAWVRQRARESFQHFGQVLLEIALLVRLSPRGVLAQTRQHGLENLRAAKQRGRGVILLCAHLGNWEWLGAALAPAFEPAKVVAQPLDWPPVERLAQHWRCKGGNELVYKIRSGRRLYQALSQGALVLIMLDQGMDWYEGVWVDFFGRPACTSIGAARLAQATGAAVVPCYNLRAIDGKFDMYYLPALPQADSGDKRQDVWDNTQTYTRALEQAIGQQPGQWFWLHRRWKRRPYSPWPRREC